MSILLEAYASTTAALGTMTLLLLVQLVIADITGITWKHTPGTSVAEDHGNLLFRAVRTVANTNESIAIFICALLFCVLSGASPDYTAYGAWAFVTFRLIYAICYYSNLQTPRSIAFGFSLLSLVALLITGVST